MSRVVQLEPLFSNYHLDFPMAAGGWLLVSVMINYDYLHHPLFLSNLRSGLPSSNFISLTNLKRAVDFFFFQSVQHLLRSGNAHA